MGGENFFCLDSASDEWKQLVDIPKESNMEVVFVINGKIYIGFGGSIDSEIKLSKKEKRRKRKKIKILTKVCSIVLIQILINGPK